ncbi:MAG: hypothetical protein QF410_14710, partial [Planctomycetota bacterium]|nr:hypothetical protein [Planctomycetota bacterium]
MNLVRPLLGLLALLAFAQPAAPEALGAARVPEAELGSEFWSVAARFDSGHHLVLELCITNVGFGDGNAAVIGHLIEPDGTVHAFDGASRDGEWSLSQDRLHVRVKGVELDQRRPVHHLRVDKRRVKLDLDFEPGGSDLRLAAFGGPDRGFDLLALEAPARAILQMPGEEEEVLVGRVARTHRWSEGLESGFLLRRIELFTLRGDVEAYLVDVLDPDGGSRSWLTVQRDGEVLRSQPVEVQPVWGIVEGPSGFPVPEGLTVTGEQVRGHVDLRPSLVRYDPLADLPAVVRWAISPFLRWRATWSESPFELELT